MSRDFATSFYHSSKWKKVRENYLAIHPYCERCEKIGLLVPATHVHHKIYLNEHNINDPMITLNADNLEALCESCHSKEHNSESQTDKYLLFDSDGNLVRVDERK